MTPRQLIARLEACGIENAAGEARLLVEHLTPHAWHLLRALPDAPIPDPNGVLAAATERRLSREPLQYILGSWSFYRQEYEVSPDCLVPRPDTECLVEQAIALAPQGGRVLELCTGSGCIAISLLCERPDLTAVAVELCPATLALAQRNALRNGISPDRLQLLPADVLHPDFPLPAGEYHLILANPPYIPTAELASLPPETKQEPRIALDGGEDGLLFYRRFVRPDYLAALAPDGALCLEIGYDQADALRALAEAADCSCRILRDYGGNDRVAILRPRLT